MNKVESAVKWMINLAEDDRHGYSQANRWGQDYDCSSAVIEAYEQAGIPVKEYGATYTGNMREAFLKAGFEDVTASINLNTGAGLIRGDVPLNYVNHTCMYIGDGEVVNARGNDGHPEPGDQTGNEIRIQPYFNYPNGGWNCILRYPEPADDEDDADEDPDVIHPAVHRSCFHLQYGDGCTKGQKPLPQIKAWQNLLICWGYEKDLGKYGADGEFGTLTMVATQKWQQKCKDIGGDVEVNGVVDSDDWEEIIRVPVDL